MSRDNELSVSENIIHEVATHGFNTQLVGKKAEFIDLNLLLKSNWKRFENTRLLQMAARLDSLPSVEGDEEKWQFVFDGLLSMIMKHLPDGFFFLHIKCELLSVNTSTARLKKGFRIFQIHFKTNITVNENWLQLYNLKLKEIESTVNALKSTFSYNRCVESGCLFSITLPGKQD